MNDMDRARDALAYIDAGIARDAWVRIGMAAKSAGLSFDDFHNWSATGGNYVSENECRTVWKSFDESGAVTAATLFGMARDNGWSYTQRTNENRPVLPPAKPAKAPQKSVKKGTIMNADAVWARCIPASLADAYVYRKQGTPDGLRVYPSTAPLLIIREQNVAGYLVVPCWSGDKLQTLQFIPPENGDKLNLPGASFNDGFFAVGEIT